MCVAGDGGGLWVMRGCPGGGRCEIVCGESQRGVGGAVY